MLRRKVQLHKMGRPEVIHQLRYAVRVLARQIGKAKFSRKKHSGSKGLEAESCLVSPKTIEQARRVGEELPETREEWIGRDVKGLWARLQNFNFIPRVRRNQPSGFKSGCSPHV